MSSKKATRPADEPQAKAPAPESGPVDSGQEAEAAQTEALSPEAVPVITPEEFEALKKQLEEVHAEAAEYKDGWQRAVAEFSNYRKRLDRENESTYQSAVASIAKHYLPVLDDLERALATRPADLAWADGIELICRKLQAILEAEGIRRIEAEGQPFDPNLHEAISQEPSNDHESGRVIEVIRNGYALGDRVIRPAIVRVAR
jgi:molecular chaperone GrpE